ncbi:MAG: hypothetical protein CM1200mP22_26650 [Dehalococcoidia bacterium]|nr:MAG: hypothetical protein CM1200mP22_26650 [Dehalococcoidia bacterium]
MQLTAPRGLPGPLVPIRSRFIDEQPVYGPTHLLTRISTGPNSEIAVDHGVDLLGGSDIGRYDIYQAPESMAATSNAPFSLGGTIRQWIFGPFAAKAWTMARPMLVPPCYFYVFISHPSSIGFSP